MATTTQPAPAIPTPDGGSAQTILIGTRSFRVERLGCGSYLLHGARATYGAVRFSDDPSKLWVAIIGPSLKSPSGFANVRLSDADGNLAVSP